MSAVCEEKSALRLSFVFVQLWSEGHDGCWAHVPILWCKGKKAESINELIKKKGKEINTITIKLRRLLATAA